MNKKEFNRANKHDPEVKLYELTYDRFVALYEKATERPFHEDENEKHKTFLNALKGEIGYHMGWHAYAGEIVYEAICDMDKNEDIIKTGRHRNQLLPDPTSDEYVVPGYICTYKMAVEYYQEYEDVEWRDVHASVQKDFFLTLKKEVKKAYLKLDLEDFAANVALRPELK